MKKNSTHYTGVLSLENINGKEKEKELEGRDGNLYYIVDGQQRITTSIILIWVILNNLKKKNIEWIDDNNKVNNAIEKYLYKIGRNDYKTYKFGYNKDNPSNEYLKTKIFGHESGEREEDESLYTYNLNEAKVFFIEKIEKLNNNEIQNIFYKLTKCFKFNVYYISNDFDVFVAFETMNNRGKKLSNLELLKNRLIYLSTKFNDDESDKNKLRSNIGNCWQEIYTYLGKNKDNILDDDEFLKNHWIMYFKYSREKGNDYIDDILKKRFTIKNIMSNDKDKLNIKTIEEYIKSLKCSIKHWYYLFNPEKSNYDEKIKIRLDKLKRLGYGSFKPLLMAIFSNEKYDTKTLCELLSLMERFIFLVFEICSVRSNVKDSEFYGYANKYYYGEIELKDIIGEDDENWDKCSGLYKHLIYYIYYYFDNFKKQIQNNFSKDDKYGYYSWKGLKYFLYEYELYLKENEYKENEYKIKSWDEYIRPKKDHETIEHIIPQTPKTKVLKTKNKKLIKYFTHTLGNLIPLSKAKNSSLSNEDFNDKKHRFKSGSYSEIEICNNSQWGENEIEERTIKLINFLFNRWEIKDYYFKDDDIKNNELQDKIKQIKEDLIYAGK
ncbi:DUF262 domain-containing protein [Campylobacter jejuni]|nr:DUF262 domain-containing protein [Campylobacter jejuni]ECJ8325086.1 DUF262 domain-containing protein [Campylobacter jejuni]EHQ1141115.1 DUF262 domain-containing protein [Campylobacter jejuni]EJM9403708.1 DUF262 domain-containing protein [Campylobacter jejuni]ELP5659121.1 DUF262 domain-containing protein [Campylobacter jejuni]